MGENYKDDSQLNTWQAKIPAYQKGMANATRDAQAGIAQGAEQQLQNNRLDTSNPFSAQTFNPDGSVSLNFTGGMGQAAQGLQGQVAGLGQGMDWNQFGQLGTGDQARDQAINAAYGQASSRLDPMWSQREDQARTRLLNQGLDPGSEAFRNEMSQLGNQRTDAYNQAMFSAIGQGREAGDSVFRNNMGARQQAITEALKARGMPLEELQKMQGFLSGQPQYNADNSSLAGALASGNMGMQGIQNMFGMGQQGFDNRFAQLKGSNEQSAAMAQGGMSGMAALAALLPLMFSDERLKTDIVRLEQEAIPGVPLASWTWKDSGSRDFGVIAQDVQRVRPDLVHAHESGFLMVDYGGLRGDK